MAGSLAWTWFNVRAGFIVATVANAAGGGVLKMDMLKMSGLPTAFDDSRVRIDVWAIV